MILVFFIPTGNFDIYVKIPRGLNILSKQNKDNEGVRYVKMVKVI